jgi:hypothetical protein
MLLIFLGNNPKYNKGGLTQRKGDAEIIENLLSEQVLDSAIT